MIRLWALGWCVIPYYFPCFPPLFLGVILLAYDPRLTYLAGAHTRGSLTTRPLGRSGGGSGSSPRHGECSSPVSSRTDLWVLKGLAQAGLPVVGRSLRLLLAESR